MGLFGFHLDLIIFNSWSLGTMLLQLVAIAIILIKLRVEIVCGSLSWGEVAGKQGEGAVCASGTVRVA